MRISKIVCGAVWMLILSSIIYAVTSATVSIDYNTTNGGLNKSMLLNLARGWKGPINNTTWHNSFYGTMTTIGIQELRMDWIPSDSTYHVISRNASGQLVYDFTRLDGILVPLLKRGMRPVMCMNMENIAAMGITNGMPADMNDYTAVVRTFVQHYTFHD